jgi:kinesin family protein 2/24
MDGEIDCVSAINPKVYIYDCKLKIDGYTKYIDVNEFNFDNAFNENDNTYLLYKCSIQPSLGILLKGGVVTCFAYGQTGSGKTYTMQGIQDIAIENIFQIFYNLERQMNTKFSFYISFYELYLGLLYDLLNNRNKLMALEDKNQKVQIYGLTEKLVESPNEMKSIIDFANRVRTTHNTVTNETSSRSHAVCNFIIKTHNYNIEKEYAKLSLVDLAGSERATETQSNDKNRLAEGADINKSLLALKECIRALDARKKGNTDNHVPFRNSKLTLVLRDSFLGNADLCKIIMISCISPSNHSANHTINTLRYSMRLKEKIPIGNHNNNVNTFGKPIGTKKSNIINLTKNKNLSKSPNIKRNISKQKENFHIIEKSKNNNKIHYSNGNINYNHKEINLAQNKKNQNKKIILTKNKNNMNINRQKNQNVNKNLTNKYFQKKNTNYNNVNKKQALTLNHRPVTTKLTINPKKVSNHKYSIIVNNKKKELKRFQTNSNKISKSKDYKLKKIDNNKIINNTTINPIKYYPSYKGNNGQIYNYYNVYNSLPNINNFNVSANHTHYMNKRNTDLNIDIDPGKDLIYDQIDVINSQQKYLTEDGNLINKFKGLTKDSVNKQIYKPVIENIIQTKQNYLNQLQDNIIEYKKLIYNYNQ